MAIHYVVATCKNVLSNKANLKRYARVQSSRTVQKDELAQYAASHYGVNLDKHCVEAVIDMLQRSLLDFLHDGCRVSMGELGTFYSHIESATKTEEEYAKEGFRPSRDIKDVTVKWQPSEELKSLKNAEFIEFKQSATVRARLAKLKEKKQRPEQ